VTAFTRTKGSNDIYTYTLVEDPRFTIEASTRATTLGTGSMVFGQITYGDGHAVVTGWHIMLGRKRFGGAVSGLLKDQKAKLLDPAFRAWALERAGLS
jgi:hypothetical protein